MGGGEGGQQIRSPLCSSSSAGVGGIEVEFVQAGLGVGRGRPVREGSAQKQFGLRLRAETFVRETPERQQSVTAGRAEVTAAPPSSTASVSTTTDARNSGTGVATALALAAGDVTAAAVLALRPGDSDGAASLEALQLRAATEARTLALTAVLAGSAREVQLLLGWMPGGRGLPSEIGGSVTATTGLPSTGSSAFGKAAARPGVTAPATAGSLAVDIAHGVANAADAVPFVAGPLARATQRRSARELYGAVTNAAAGGACVTALILPLVQLALENDEVLVEPSARLTESLRRLAALRILRALIRVSPPCRSRLRGSARAVAWLALASLPARSDAESSAAGAPRAAAAPPAATALLASNASRISIGGVSWDAKSRSTTIRLAAALPVDRMGCDPWRCNSSGGRQRLSREAALDPDTSVAEPRDTVDVPAGLLIPLMRGALRPDPAMAPGWAQSHVTGAAARAAGTSQPLTDPPSDAATALLASAVEGEEIMLRLEVVLALVEPRPSASEGQARAELAADSMLDGAPLAVLVAAARSVSSLLSASRGGVGGLPGVLHLAASSSTDGGQPLRRGRVGTGVALVSVDSSQELGACVAAMRRAAVAVSVVSHCIAHPVALLAPPRPDLAQSTRDSDTVIFQVFRAIAATTPALTTCVAPLAMSCGASADGRSLDSGYLSRLRLAAACAECQLCCLGVLARALAAHGQTVLFALAGSSQHAATVADGGGETGKGTADATLSLLLPRVTSVLRLRVLELIHFAAAARGGPGALLRQDNPVRAADLDAVRSMHDAPIGRPADVSDKEVAAREAAYACIVHRICVAAARLLLRVPSLASFIDSAVMQAAQSRVAQLPLQPTASTGGVVPGRPVDSNARGSSSGEPSPWELCPGVHVAGLADALSAFQQSGSLLLDAAPELAALAKPLRLALQQQQQPSGRGEAAPSVAGAAGTDGRSASAARDRPDNSLKQQRQSLGSPSRGRAGDAGGSSAAPGAASTVTGQGGGGGVRKAARLAGAASPRVYASPTRQSAAGRHQR